MHSSTDACHRRTPTRYCRLVALSPASWSSTTLPRIRGGRHGLQGAPGMVGPQGAWHSPCGLGGEPAKACAIYLVGWPQKHNAMMVDRQHGGHVREEADENYVALVGSEQGLGQDARVAHLWRHQELAGCPIQQLLVEPGVIGSRPIPQGVPPKTADQLQSIPGDLRDDNGRLAAHDIEGRVKCKRHRAAPFAQLNPPLVPSEALLLQLLLVVQDVNLCQGLASRLHERSCSCCRRTLLLHLIHHRHFP
mmetsp:Transcript_27840/g.75272  ORF Transcript_27840/g.75272 Transcript_27840/m.75272 type:complete len:249 (-) Transcript_27840:190-936(-)